MNIEELKRTMSTIAEQWPELKAKTADESAGPCPKCGGADRFIVTPSRDKFWCRQCQWKGDHLDLFCHLQGKTIKELLAGNGQPDTQRGRIVKTWDYHDADGQLVYQVCRKEPGKNGRKKHFVQRRPDGNGGWIWDMNGVARVLYRLPTLKKSNEVWIPEGEKCVDALVARGFTATTNTGGAGKWSDSYSETLRGKDVLLVGDNDDPGRKHLQVVANSLNGIAKSVKVIELPDLPEGGDVVDFIAKFDDPAEAAERLAMMADGAAPWKPEAKDQFSLADFSLNGEATLMEMKMLADRFVLGEIAILGQSTAIYSKPNAGKTLLVLWMLIESITRGEIEGGKVYYINADDNHKGLVHKLKLAERHGFLMLAPGYKDFKTDQLTVYIEKMIQADTARNSIVILDTVKKFTDLMKKTAVSVFGESVRRFVSHGGTVIMLAHVNKHRDEDKKVIYGGVSDLVDDADCAYTLDTVVEDTESGLRTVKFENFKNRGDVAREAFYKYYFMPGVTYYQRLDSVVSVDEAEQKEAERQRRLDIRLEKNQKGINAIIDCITENINQKTILIGEAAARSGLSKKRITDILAEHTGGKPSENQFWHLLKEEKNTHVYQLNYGVFTKNMPGAENCET